MANLFSPKKVGGKFVVPRDDMNLRRYLADLSRGGSPYHVRLAAAGTLLKGRYRSSRDLRLAEYVQDQEPEVGLCYMNAGRYVTLVVDDDLAQYWEGYWMYSGGIFPVHHAWLVRDGKVIDFTAEAADRTSPYLVDPKKDRYFGIHVPTPFVRKQMFKNKAWTPVSPQYLESLHEGHEAVRSGGRSAGLPSRSRRRG